MVLSPVVTAYRLVSWILGASNASNGFGFPFDQPHLVFYQRLQHAYPTLKYLKSKGVKTLPLAVLNKALSDQVLKNSQASIEEKIVIFDQLRVAMRIACTDSEHGLNDEGSDDIENIEIRVKAFRGDEKLQVLSAGYTSYRKMTTQIDKYWEKLLAKQIQVETPAGKIIIQPQRTNNLMEQSFRFFEARQTKKEWSALTKQSINRDACRYAAGQKFKECRLHGDFNEGPHPKGFV